MKAKKVPKAFIICKGFVSNKVLSHFQNKANVKTQVAELLSFDFFFLCQYNFDIFYSTKPAFLGCKVWQIYVNKTAKYLMMFNNHFKVSEKSKY